MVTQVHIYIYIYERVYTMMLFSLLRWPRCHSSPSPIFYLRLLPGIPLCRTPTAPLPYPSPPPPPLAKCSCGPRRAHRSCTWREGEGEGRGPLLRGHRMLLAPLCLLSLFFSPVLLGGVAAKFAVLRRLVAEHGSGAWSHKHIYIYIHI